MYVSVNEIKGFYVYFMFIFYTSNGAWDRCSLIFPFSSAERAMAMARRSFCIDESVRFPLFTEKIFPPLSDRFSALNRLSITQYKFSF